MTRINLIQPQDASGKAQELLDVVKKNMGIVPNLTKVMANGPVVLKQYLAGHEALSAGVLQPVEREQIALRVAELNACHYCLSAHSALGKMRGLSAEEILENRAGYSVDPRAQALLNLTTAIVKERGQVSDGDLEDARNAGLRDSEIVEIVGHVAQNTLTNYLNNVARTEIDFPKAPTLEANTEALSSSH